MDVVLDLMILSLAIIIHIFVDGMEFFVDLMLLSRTRFRDHN